MADPLVWVQHRQVYSHLLSGLCDAPRWEHQMHTLCIRESAPHTYIYLYTCVCVYVCGYFCWIHVWSFVFPFQFSHCLICILLSIRIGIVSPSLSFRTETDECMHRLSFIFQLSILLRSILLRHSAILDASSLLIARSNWIGLNANELTGLNGSERALTNIFVSITCKKPDR